jgi:hypothetical protein
MIGDDLVRQLMSGAGWESLGGQALDDLPPAKRDEALEFASLYRDVFVNNPAGARLLEHWIRTTIMRPTVQGRSYAEDAVREGRADFVRGILEQISMANRGGQ